MTGLSLKKDFEAKYGPDAVFEKGKPEPKPLAGPGAPARTPTAPKPAVKPPAPKKKAAKAASLEGAPVLSQP